MTDKNPYRTLHARMSPPGAAWDEGFAAGCAAATPDPPHTPDCSANMLANFADCSCAATPDPQDEEACLRWTCESCGWNVVVPMPGYAGDGHYHYGPPQNTRCGPLVARREGFIRALPGADLLAAPSHGGDEAAGTPTTVLNTEPSSAAASPDERLREALREIVDTAPGIDRWTIDRRLDDEQWTGKVAVEVVRASSVDVMVAALRAALAAADRPTPPADERLREALAWIAEYGERNGDLRTGHLQAVKHIARNALGLEPDLPLAAADREAPDEAGRICCRGMGADGGCNICAAEATR